MGDRFRREDYMITSREGWSHFERFLADHGELLPVLEELQFARSGYPVEVADKHGRRHGGFLLLVEKEGIIVPRKAGKRVAFPLGGKIRREESLAEQEAQLARLAAEKEALAAAGRGRKEKLEQIRKEMSRLKERQRETEGERERLASEGEGEEDLRQLALYGDRIGEKIRSLRKERAALEEERAKAEPEEAERLEQVERRIGLVRMKLEELKG